jgi:hypothetical protein
MTGLGTICDFPSVLTEPPKSIAPINPHDPARLGYPVALPVEIAMRTSGTRAVCEAYGICEEEWEIIRHDPTFLADLQRAAEMLKESGAGFRMKAKLQAEELLKTSWRMIHSPATPPSVAADLIKSTARWAQYDVPPSQQATTGSGFSININLGNAPSQKLVMDV